MLQQTQVKTVLAYWEGWMRALPDFAALAKAKPHTLHKLWEGLGYYTRVRNLHRAAQLIMAQHGGRFPRDFEDVLALPGVGRYTAGAICSIAFNQPKPILDGNVMRVLARWQGIPGDPRERSVNARLWQLAEDLVQRAAKTRSPQPATHNCAQLNESLMELGALVCTPRQPRCGACPIARDCVAYQQGRVDQLPGLSRRTRATPRRFVAFVAQRRGLLLVRQRPAGGVNAQLWEFPNLEVAPDDSDLKRAARCALGVRPETLEPLGTIKHSITRYRITLEAYRFTSRRADEIPQAKGRWLSRSRLHQLAFTSAHRRILERFAFVRAPSGVV